MKFFYLNSRNERIDFYDSPYILVTSSLLNYSYSYTKKAKGRREKIDSINREIQEKEIGILIATDNTLPLKEREIQFVDAVNSFVEIVEKDVCSGEKGRIYTDEGYYIEGFVMENVKNDIFYQKKYMGIDFKFVTDYPVWCREEWYSFAKQEVNSSNNKKYGYKYPHRYANGLNNTYVINENFVPSNFKLIMYGPVVNPMVVIGENTYLVNIVLENGERIEIDSREETITKIMRMGERVNAFHHRQKRRSFFKKIPSGRQLISWTGQFPFDLVLYEERSEPKWSKLVQH